MQKNSYNYNELIDCGHGKLFGAGNAKLPLPPMLMFDRISNITSEGPLAPDHRPGLHHRKPCYRAGL